MSVFRQINLRLRKQVIKFDNYTTLILRVCGFSISVKVLVKCRVAAAKSLSVLHRRAVYIFSFLGIKEIMLVSRLAPVSSD